MLPPPFPYCCKRNIGSRVDAENNRVGINKGDPAYALDVSGSISGNAGYFSKIFITGTNKAVLQITGNGGGGCHQESGGCGIDRR